jgi:hypothetical protein
MVVGYVGAPMIGYYRRSEHAIDATFPPNIKGAVAAFNPTERRKGKRSSAFVR